MTRTVTIPTTGAVTVESATTSYPSTAVGSPPQWADDSDATYVHIQGLYQGTTAISGAGTAWLTTGVDVSQNTALVTVSARIRLSSLNGPVLPWVTVRAPNGVPLLTGGESGATSSATGWVTVPLAEATSGGLATFLYMMKSGEESHSLRVETPLTGFTFPGSLTAYEWTIYEAKVIVETPSVDAPPCRLFPREDGLGVGSGRHYPPAKSQQRSIRGVGYY